MATYKSDVVAALDSGDRLADRVDHDNEITAVLTLAGAFTTSDTALLCRIPTDAKITSIRLWSDDLGTTGDISMGFHRIGAGNTAGAAVDVDAIGTAIDVNAAALADTEVRFETLNFTTINTKVKDLNATTIADFASSNEGEWFLSLTPTENTTAGGDIAVRVKLQRG